MATIRTAAKELEISESRLRRDIRAGKVEHLKVGDRVLVDLEQLAGQYVARGVGFREISEATGLTVNAIRQGTKEGWIPSWMDGNAFRFDVEAVKAAILARMAVQQGEE